MIFGAPVARRVPAAGHQGQKLDEQNGLSITFVERTPDAYTAQFNSGEFQLGGSASLLTVGQADVRGVKVAVSVQPVRLLGRRGDVARRGEKLSDLEGKELAAARGTTNFLMFDWFARQQGVDPAKLSVVNTATPGLVGYALADRAAGISFGSRPTRSCLPRSPSLRTLDLQIAEKWTAFAGSRNIPYLGVAAHIDWIEKNRAAVRSFMRPTRQPPSGPLRTRTRPRN